MKRKAIPRKIRDFILVASKHQCSICQAKTVEVHHIVPVSKGGTNNLENLMAVCPNCHTNFHEGRFTTDQMRTYRIQWMQKCSVYLTIGIPTEKLTKDQKIALELPLETKIQFLEESSRCIIETVSLESKQITIYFKSGSQTIKEVDKDIINISQLVYRFFDKPIIQCIHPNYTIDDLKLGADKPELYSFTIKHADVENFVYGKTTLNQFWERISFFKKRFIHKGDSSRAKFDIQLVI